MRLGETSNPAVVSLAARTRGSCGSFVVSVGRVNTRAPEDPPNGQSSRTISQSRSAWSPVRCLEVQKEQQNLQAVMATER